MGMPEGPHRTDLVNEDPEMIRERLAAIVRSADDAIFSKDVNGIITSWNNAAERLYGYTAEEIIGRPISIVVPSERQGEELEILRRVLNDEELDHYETRRVTKDGRILDVSISASPIHDSTGAVVGASVIARDMTSMRQSRGLSDRLASIVAGSEDAIYSKDENGVVDSWNPAAERLYGYPAEEAIGRHIRFLVPLDRKGEETDILQRILRGERIEHYETQRLTKDGDVIDVSISVSPIHNEKQQVIGASVIARDVATRKRLEGLKRGLDRAEIIARAAHDLRTPLSALAGFTTIISQGSRLSDENLEEAVQGITRQLERVNRLIDDLLDLSYVESGRFETILRPVELADVIDDAVETAPPPEGKDLVIDVPDGLKASADAARLGQVLVNLLTNAYKYGGVRVALTAWLHGGGVSIAVEDDGPGVPSHIHETLFEPFVRGHPGSQGTGLGLAIAARLVEAQNGRIELVPDRRGARFVISLPAARAAGSATRLRAL